MRCGLVVQITFNKTKLTLYLEHITKKDAGINNLLMKQVPDDLQQRTNYVRACKKWNW